MKASHFGCGGAAVFVFSLMAGGCNVDARWTGRYKPKGSIEPAEARLASPHRDLYTAGPQEVDLVEQVVAQRDAYRQSLERLHDYYAHNGHATKQAWSAREIQSLRAVKAFRYLDDAEVPSEKLRPVESVPDADVLFERGKERMRAGGHGVPGIYREDRMVEAVAVFRDLIRRYPKSDKIDDAAYLLGEIHKDYLPDQDTLAVQWYGRVWEWDPGTDYPAMFKAAQIYDFRLNQRDRALELYQQVKRDARVGAIELDAADRRIRELSRGERAAGTQGP